jgi:hypothetical protein
VDAIRIGVVSDYQDGNEAHLALGPAADHAAERAGLRERLGQHHGRWRDVVPLEHRSAIAGRG